MIPWGPFHPDVAGINTNSVREARNVLPHSLGFAPFPGLVPNGDALPSACIGAATLLLDSGGVANLAGTGTKLYRRVGNTWQDISRPTGGPYSYSQGEHWRFVLWGDIVITTNYVDAVQALNLANTNFSALAGSPPRARFVDIIRDQVVLAGVNGNERRLQWSGTNNPEFWTVGQLNADYQDMPSGGPVMQFIGGASGYVFQAGKVTRMTQTPGQATIYQFDEVQGAKGVAAPNSLVRVQDWAAYLSQDGFYRFSTVSGQSSPIGVNKWREWFLKDRRPGTDLSVLGMSDPVRPIVMWPYVSRDNSSSISTAPMPDRMLIWDWSIDEASFVDMGVEACAAWIYNARTIDNINSYGALDALPYSLDSAFWKGGSALAGIFGVDHRLGHLTGPSLAATITTSDGMGAQRVLITGTVPLIDGPGTRVAIACRERDSDSTTNMVNFPVSEGMEDTGEVPAFVSGNVVRAQITIPAGDNWTIAKGMKTTIQIKKRGRR